MSPIRRTRAVIEGLFPADEGDRPLPTGYVCEPAADVERVPRLPADWFSTVVRVPGSHGIRPSPSGPAQR
ncbi:hypothetical protein A8713_28310 [Streptomyces sp. SAT1]|nr:hypothetical protein A8713_28310 [Streptomyces sp. SAT1]